MQVIVWTDHGNISVRAVNTEGQFHNVRSDVVECIKLYYDKEDVARIARCGSADILEAAVWDICVDDEQFENFAVCIVK